jgi:hypothetical protein
MRWNLPAVVRTWELHESTRLRTLYYMVAELNPWSDSSGSGTVASANQASLRVYGGIAAGLAKGYNYFGENRESPAKPPRTVKSSLLQRFFKEARPTDSRFLGQQGFAYRDLLQVIRRCAQGYDLLY